MNTKLYFTMVLLSLSLLVPFISHSQVEPNKVFTVEGSEWGDGVTSKSLTEDGSLLAISGRDGKISIFEVASGKRLKILNTSGQSLAFSHSKKFLAVGGYPNKVDVYDIQSGDKIHEFVQEPFEGELVQFFIGVASIAFSPDDSILAMSVGGSHYLTAWNLQSGEQTHRFRIERSGTYSMIFYPDGKRLFVDSRTGDIIDIESETILHHFESEASTITNDFKSIVTLDSLDDEENMSFKYVFNFWDANTGELIKSLEPFDKTHVGPSINIHISPTGDKFLKRTESDQNASFQLRSIDARSSLRTFSGLESKENAYYQFSPNGKYVLASFEESNDVILYDISDLNASILDSKFHQ